MGKKLVIDYVQQQSWKDINIIYPFCIKYGNEKKGFTYLRYLEDGRYEYICAEPLKMHFSYGNQINSIQGLLNNDEYWYKQLANIHEIITNEDFEKARKEFFDKYQNYLNSTDYVSKDVKKLIENSANHYQIEKNEIEERLNELPTNNDIIINSGNVPF